MFLFLFAETVPSTFMYLSAGFLDDRGVNVIAEGSFHAETINMMGRNLAVVEDVVSKGTGNEVDLEQILLWNPDVIIFAPDSCYDSIATSEQWQSVSAVAAGTYYKTPLSPYGWLSSPPAVQRYLGMLWLGTLLYPEYAEYDLQEKVTEYYKLFYGCELTDGMYDTLIAYALPQQASNPQPLGLGVFLQIIGFFINFPIACSQKIY